MGTLQKQPPRDKCSVEDKNINNFLARIQAIAKKNKLTIDQVLKTNEILELERKNDLFLKDGDIKDEQLAGFGELMSELTATISELSEQIKESLDR